MKHLKFLSCFLLMVACAGIFVSCSSDDPVEPDGSSTGNSSDYGKIKGGDFVATGSFTDLGSSSVRILCSLNDSKLGGLQVLSTFGVVISRNKSNLKDNGEFYSTNGVTGNQYEVECDRLIPGQTYYYCAYMSFQDGSKHFAREIKSFTTETAISSCILGISGSELEFSVNSCYSHAREIYIRIAKLGDSPITDYFLNLKTSLRKKYTLYFNIGYTNELKPWDEFSFCTCYEFRDNEGTVYCCADVNNNTLEDFKKDLNLKLDDATGITNSTADIGYSFYSSYKNILAESGILISENQVPTEDHFDTKYYRDYPFLLSSNLVYIHDLKSATTYYYRAFVRYNRDRYILTDCKKFTTTSN